MLWRDLKVFQIYGANTDVGKTIVSTLLCKALQRRAPPNGLLYLKPVSTGPEDQADDRHITRFVPATLSKCITQFSDPVSPHLASLANRNSKLLRSDRAILAEIRELLSSHAGAGGRYAVLETAGGVLSPSPSGTLQADLYRPLRQPVVLVGDSKLGGIATTISAFESLHVRGYDLDSVILFDDPKWGNAEYLREHFKKHELATHAIPMPPPKQDSAEGDELAMAEYYEKASATLAITGLVDILQTKHFSRVSKISSMPSLAESVIWHPFRQHGIPQDLIAIDSAHGDHFAAYSPQSDEVVQIQSQPFRPGMSSAGSGLPPKPLLTPLFDGSASWWTQGLGHGNPDLALTAAHAAGRYGHVMFANAVHEPALDLSYHLLSTLANPRLSRVFFSDNGSTGMEVAVKMALRASCARYDWHKDDGKGEIGILGLSGSYHGDTIGVMNCAEPNVFNENVDWYKPWGHWWDPPQLVMREGKWQLTIKEEIKEEFDTLDEFFDFHSRVEMTDHYTRMITQDLTELVHNQKRRFGALIIEPIIMGAGGMIFVDPLFQRTLIKTIRENPSLINPDNIPSQPDPESSPAQDWSGLPIIADEVFTGLYRLGRASSSSYLSTSPSPPSPSPTPNPFRPSPTIDIAPDISVHAKLLTGGLLPLAITTASSSIFSTFLSDRKQDALLHGHSYTAHAVGCAVANKSLSEITNLDRDGSWDGYKDAWARINHKSRSPVAASISSSSTPTSPATSQPTTFSFFSPTFLSTLSLHPLISSCWALGTVLTMTLKSQSQAGGYTSTAASSLQSNLLSNLDADGAGIHSRVLGDVLYLMTSLTTPPESVTKIEMAVLRALG